MQLTRPSAFVIKLAILGTEPHGLVEISQRRFILSQRTIHERPLGTDLSIMRLKFCCLLQIHQRQLVQPAQAIGNAAFQQRPGVEWIQPQRSAVIGYGAIIILLGAASVAALEVNHRGEWC